MSYQVKRIDPYWINHPVVPVAVFLGFLLSIFGLRAENNIILGAGAVVASLAILAAAKPVISAVLGILGLIGGLLTFVVYPRGDAAAMSLFQQLLATLMFTFFYMVLMDAVILLIAVLYNFFSSGLGMGGFKMDIAEVESEEAE